jgi:hypothetical protein
MTVIAMWLGSEVRRRWRSLTVLALLIALAAGTIMSALAGARRGASVQERLNARTLPADAMILANTPGFDWRPIERLPEVASLTTFVVDYDITAVGFPVEALSFPPADDRYLRTIERPVIFEGRALNPQRADEALMTRQFATRQHKRVGDTVNIILASPEEVVDGAGTGPGGAFSGPRITVQIVGVGETSSRWGGVDYPGGQGGILLSPGLYAQHRENVVGPLGAPNYINALVRLRSGEAAIPQLIRDLARITGRSDIEVSNLVAGERDAQRHIAFESRGLTAFAAAAFLAALFLIGQAIARYAAASSDELHTLRALGMTPAVAMCAASAGPILAGLVGALTGVVGAVVVSMWLPYGTAGLMEPSPGMSWDWVVLGPGLIVVLLLVGGGTARVAWSAVAAARRERVARGSVVAFAAGRSGLPVPVVIG